jgi:hypothetical protein
MKKRRPDGRSQNFNGVEFFKFKGVNDGFNFRDFSSFRDFRDFHFS